MAYPDADYRIITSGLECKLDAKIEEQRQLDLHPTKVNVLRAMPLSIEEKRERSRKNSSLYNARNRQRAKDLRNRPEAKAKDKLRRQVKKLTKSAMDDAMRNISHICHS
tara:strand:- start:39 stop:365 length:327 start_codon:yes stop_codon:yes gene_type:complete